MADLTEISAYLHDLDIGHCMSLGGAFGLYHPTLNRMRQYPEEVVAAWLRKQDSVSNRCPPTWRNLIRALERIGQNGIAETVKNDHLPE